jgi:Cu2+-exporting ATPase
LLRRLRRRRRLDPFGRPGRLLPPAQRGRQSRSAEAVDLRAWDREDVQRLHARVEGEEREIRLALEGMHCAACAWLVDRALARQAGVVGAWANAASGRLRLRWRPADTTLSALLQRLHALGYRAFLGGDEARAQLHRRERNALLLRLAWRRWSACRR